MTPSVAPRIAQGDLNEFNQCQTQLLPLRRMGLGNKKVIMEFAAYRVLYAVQNRDPQELLRELGTLTPEELQHPFVQHAMDVQASLTAGNYARFFHLYRTTPNMGSYVLDKMLLRERVRALTKMAKAYAPTIPVALVTKQLAFVSDEAAAEFMTKAGCVLETRGDTLVFVTKTSKVAMFKEQLTQKEIHDGAAR